MTKLLKNNKGFTLVEVIVVAVIVLILAAVAIPLYNGYVRDSREAVLENAAGATASAFGAAFSTGVQLSDVTGNNSVGPSTIVFPSKPNSTDSITLQIPKNVRINITANAAIAKFDPAITGIDSAMVQYTR